MEEDMSLKANEGDVGQKMHALEVAIEEAAMSGGSRGGWQDIGEADNAPLMVVSAFDPLSNSAGGYTVSMQRASRGDVADQFSSGNEQYSSAFAVPRNMGTRAAEGRISQTADAKLIDEVLNIGHRRPSSAMASRSSSKGKNAAGSSRKGRPQTALGHRTPSKHQALNCAPSPSLLNSLGGNSWESPLAGSRRSSATLSRKESPSPMSLPSATKDDSAEYLRTGVTRAQLARHHGAAEEKKAAWLA